RQPGVEHRREPGEAMGDVGVRVGDRALVARAPVRGREWGERAAYSVDLSGDLAGAGANRVARRQSAERAEGLERRLEHGVADAADPEAVVLGLLDRRDRHLRRRECGREVAVQAEAL